LNADLLQGFYLGDLVVEPLKGQVIGRAGPRHLPPKAVEVLLCLARTPGELVTRQTLIEDAWGADSGSHEALSHAVGEIRHALDDQVDDPVFIQTLPRRGYRLVVEPTPAILDESSIIIGAKGGVSVNDIGLFENLKRRGVFETALAYLIVGWLLIQIGDIVFAQLHFPQWAGTFVTVLVIAGFPIAIALSWFLEFHHGHAVVDHLSASDLRRRRFSRTYLSVVSSLAIAAFMVYVYDRIIGLPAPETPVTAIADHQLTLPTVVENSLAVLPFVNLDGSNETQLFADALVEDVITYLSRVPGLRVASRGDSYTLAPNTPSQEVRDRLRVELYLEGSVEMSANRMRATVQLINSEDGFHILSRRFDRTRDDFFDLRDEITSLTVANVRVSLPPDLQPSSLKVVEAPSLNAYVLYRHGIESSRQPTTIDSIASALSWFDAALNVDPEYAAAHAGKCALYVEGYDEMDDPSYIERAESCCATALALNPNLDIVHTSLGDLYMSTGRHNDAEAAYLTALANNPVNIDALQGLGFAYQHLKQPLEAENILRRATDVYPGNASSFNSLGVFHFQKGRFEEAVAQFEYAFALRPNDAKYVTNLASTYMMQGNFASAARYFQRAIDIKPTRSAYSNLGLMQLYSGDYDAAVESQRSAVELQPNDLLTRANLGDTLWAAGRLPEARQALQEAEKMAARALEVNPNDPLTIMDMAWIKAGLREHDEARRFIDRATELMPDDPYAHYYDGIIHNRAGNTTQAFVSLQTAVQLGFPKALLAGDPNLANLRGDSRFSDIANGSE
jgi:tetratricopeptide (TPR) repeat protein/TolB-like protein/DNA-binding winged helix-turn-helix (wHTH) protein